MNPEHFEVLMEQFGEPNQLERMAIIGRSYMEWYETVKDSSGQVDPVAAHEFIMALVNAAHHTV